MKQVPAVPQTAYEADGFATRQRILPFNEPRFAAAWQGGKGTQRGRSPDTIEPNSLDPDALQGQASADFRWRCHTAIWAAHSCQHLPGDFVEFGVHTGRIAGMISWVLQLEEMSRKFWLFDTYEGIPILDRWNPTKKERRGIESKNAKMYGPTIWEKAQNTFSFYPNARLVKGILPESLSGAEGLQKIAFAHFDLNYFPPESETFDAVKERLLPGAMVLLDDYGRKGHENQHAGWDEFGKKYGFSIMTIPTGQGLFAWRG